MCLVPERSELDLKLFYAIDRRIPLLLKRALVDGADPFCRDALGYTPLIRAAHHMSSDCVKVLAPYGGLNLTSFGNNALHHAAATGYTPCVQALLLAGSEPNLPSQDTGDTALMLAVWSNFPSCVNALLSVSSLDLRNFAGQTAFEYALSRDTAPEIIHLFAAWHSFLEARGLDAETRGAAARKSLQRI